jgi:hypothetical protein
MVIAQVSTMREFEMSGTFEELDDAALISTINSLIAKVTLQTATDAEILKLQELSDIRSRRMMPPLSARGEAHLRRFG